MKRSPLKRKTRLRSVNRKRAKARKARDFGPYADWIRQQGCVVPGAVMHGYQVYQKFPGPMYLTQAAHVKSRGAGGTSDGNLISLCWLHHCQQHDLGIKSFAERYGIDLKAEATRLWAAYQSENGA